MKGAMMDAKKTDTLHAALAYQAARQPDHPAILCEGRSLTYQALHQESNRVAQALLASQVGRDSRVAYLGKESERYWELAFACAKTGAVLVPVNWRLTLDEVHHILADSGTELLVVDEGCRAVAEGVRDRLDRLKTVVLADDSEDGGAGWVGWTAPHPDTDPQSGGDRESAVVQIYTSGTSGRPKGVVLPHRSFFNVAEAMEQHGLDWFDWLPGDRSLIGLPGFHIGGFSYAMQGFNAGATIVSMPMFVSSSALRLIRELRITTAIVAPAMLQLLFNEPDANPACFQSLRKVVYGGSPISAPLLEQCMKMIDCDFLQIYGSSETGNFAACLPPEDHRQGNPRLLAAGRAYPGITLRIIGRDGKPVPPGTVGEVCVRSPARMLEYWRRPDATAETLVDGWIRMGDAGYLDEDGYLFVSDRVNDMIIVAGENVYPAEIEAALCAHPAVLDVAVVGIPHPRWGESVHARVVLEPGRRVTPRELMLSLRGRIADFKVPTSYDFAAALPRNPSGKVLRRMVRGELAEKTPRVGR
ncbi:long-chain-fatty-acid--CoA ligase [Streptomyces sp. NPDC001034]|uniref:long-chain-fatty-acid--CoA ligase n=1 Tax=Streptomyces sp. NPDC001034 TaxID=3154375 RepID=UPI00331A9A8D